MEQNVPILTHIINSGQDKCQVFWNILFRFAIKRNILFYNNSMEIFATRLKELRLEKQISRSVLAKDLCVSVRLISYWENAKRECDFKTLIKIADYFGVTIDYLLGRTDY